MIIHPPSEITVAQLFEAYYDCRRHKRATRSALAFELALEDNLMDLHAELKAGSWMPAPASVFAITRPKPREVWAAAFRDRIVHHLVYRAISPQFERSFIADSCACIKGRGTLYGADRLASHLRSATENWNKQAFVLKADIANFFGSIRHDDLFIMLARRVKDPTMLDLCRKLVFQDVRRDAIVRDTAGTLARVPPHKSLFWAPTGIGLPIGPRRVTVEVDSCQGCPALDTHQIGHATYAYCRADHHELITGWWLPQLPPPSWCPGRRKS